MTNNPTEQQHETKHYYITKLKRENITVTYNSERDEVEIVIDRQLKNGHVFHTDHISFHPSYFEPLAEMMEKILEEMICKEQ